MSSAIDSFRSRGRLGVGDTSYEIFRLTVVEGADRLPFSLRVLLENLLRTEDARNVTADNIRALAAWDPSAAPRHGDPVHDGAGAAAGLHGGAGDGRPGHHA